VILSLFFSCARRVKDWYDGLEVNERRLVMFGSLVAEVRLGLKRHPGR